MTSIPPPNEMTSAVMAGTLPCTVSNTTTKVFDPDESHTDVEGVAGAVELSLGGSLLTGNPGVLTLLKVLVGGSPSSMAYTLTDDMDDRLFSAAETSLDKALYAIEVVVCWRNFNVKLPDVAVHLISCTSTCCL